jgi:hypothetical protein
VYRQSRAKAWQAAGILRARRAGITRLRLAECPAFRMSQVSSCRMRISFGLYWISTALAPTCLLYRRLLYSGGIQAGQLSVFESIIAVPPAFMVPPERRGLADAATAPPGQSSAPNSTVLGI